MKEPEIAGYKMVYRAPDETLDPKVFTESNIAGMKLVENVYGPVFTVRAIRHALDFLEKKTGEKSSQDVKDLAQLKDYIISKLDKYPAAYCAITYSQVKTESELQGRTGAGTSIEMIDRAKAAQKELAAKSTKVNLNGQGVFEKLRLMNANRPAKNIAIEYGYKDIADGSTEIFHPKCVLFDGCKAALDEGLLKRPDGKPRCALSAFSCQMYKVLMGYNFDYECREVCKPHCIIKLFVA